MFLVLVMAFGMVSCKEKKREDLIPPTTGKPGEVVLVMDDDLYKGAAGDSIFGLLSQHELALPQTGFEGAEPMFNVVQVPKEAFTNIFRSHRNIIIVEVGSAEPKKRMKVERSYWSKNQLLIRLGAPDRNALIELVDENRDAIIQTLRNAEIDRQVMLNRQFENLELANSIMRKHQIQVSFPKEFKPRVDTGQFIWVQHDPQDMIQGVLIWIKPYTDEKQLDFELLIRDIDETMKPRVPGSSPGSHMAIEFDAPYYSQVLTVNDNYVREIKGLWEMTGDWMGGPFISWTFVDEARSRLITAFGFVYAPKYNKRNHIRKVESILKTIDFPDQVSQAND